MAGADSANNIRIISEAELERLNVVNVFNAEWSIQHDGDLFALTGKRAGVVIGLACRKNPAIVAFTVLPGYHKLLMLGARFVMSHSVFDAPFAAAAASANFIASAPGGNTLVSAALSDADVAALDSAGWLEFQPVPYSAHDGAGLGFAGGVKFLPELAAICH